MEKSYVARSLYFCRKALSLCLSTNQDGLAAPLKIRKPTENLLRGNKELLTGTHHTKNTTQIKGVGNQ